MNIQNNQNQLVPAERQRGSHIHERRPKHDIDNQPE